MAVNDDDFGDVVGALDPMRDEHPPARESDRYRRILEFAMHTQTPLDDVPALNRARAVRRDRTRRTRGLAALAAAVVAATGALVVVQSSDPPTARAVVMSAAERIGEVTSLEGTATQTQPGNKKTSRIRVTGDDFEVVGDTRYADGHREGSTFVAIDGTGYETVEGRTTATSLGAQDRLVPFGKASAAVVSAALTGSNIVERGDPTVADIATTRYEIHLTGKSVAALSALTPNQLAWFELENPSEVDRLTVWVAAGLVRQIEIKSGDRSTRTRFFNFNGDIRVTAPPGPYAESEAR